MLCRQTKLVLAVQQWHNNSLAAAFNKWHDQALLKLSHRDKVNTTDNVTIWQPFVVIFTRTPNLYNAYRLAGHRNTDLPLAC